MNLSNFQVILDRLRNNPKIHYDSVTGRYRFKPAYAIRSQHDLVMFLETRPSLVVDGDLLECYKSIDGDISDLLAAKRIRAIRQSDFDRTVKCSKISESTDSVLPSPSQERPNRQPKCSLYEERCSSCSTNRGVVLMKRFEAEIESLHVDAQIKAFWNSVQFPHISEIHRLTQSQSQHLLTTNTSQLLSNKSTRKVRGAGRARGKFSWSEVNANRVSNVHILPLLEQSENSR